MKAWYLSLNRREQISVLAMVAVIVLYCFYVLLWSPLGSKRDEMQARNVSAALSLQKVDAMVSELQLLRSSDEGPGKRNLTALISQSTAQTGLPVSRLQPNSRGEIQVRFEQANFDKLLNWLHQMEYVESLLLTEVSITRAGTAGRVDATVRVAQGG